MGDRDKPGLVASFQEHYGDLMRFLIWRTGDADHAADVAQDTYFRLAALPDSEKPITNFRAYILRVARNLSIDRLRREKWMVSAETVEDEMSALADDSVPLDEALLSKQRLRLLDEALRDLPPKPREALLLHRVAGLSQAEIATRLGVSESMVTKYVAQAMLHCHKWRQRLDRDKA
ncbi:RNA polymerase sigma factor [Azospirillum doebereinerae]|uniref:RNA polymerase sigma factor n=1 Tax=Azospirillum doebereinerae TaxID=92933 RepID=A0A433J7R3_9PROT|nr:RNA polymerase sigma factor [Azospirillum doebereinerae]MCG5242592.1 RNA polymerase sigma factor [Azospirillum doebereinerae]RUQ69720.1 RNA polymerase sigma factor [Azospirillum doebereinerae]